LRLKADVETVDFKVSALLMDGEGVRNYFGVSSYKFLFEGVEMLEEGFV